MCNPRKLAQDVILRRAVSAAAAAVDVGRNYNSTHHAAVADKPAAVPHPARRSPFLPFICTPTPSWRRSTCPLTCAHPLASFARWSVRPSVRRSVCRSVCLFDTRHAYAIFVVGLIAIYFASPATAASAVGRQHRPCRATSRGFAPVVDYDVTGISFDAGNVTIRALSLESSCGQRGNCPSCAPGGVAYFRDEKYLVVQNVFTNYQCQKAVSPNMFWLDSLNLQADQTYEIGVDMDQRKRQYR